jgi:hypothetical protein
MMARSVRRHGTIRSGDGSLQEKFTGKGEEENAKVVQVRVVWLDQRRARESGSKSFFWRDS